jgi:hypothetical protein
MFVLSGQVLGFDYSKSTAIAFTATETISNCHAVAIGVFGIDKLLPELSPVSRSSGIDSLSECRFLEKYYPAAA